MVLGRKLEEWLERDDIRQREVQAEEEALRQLVEDRLNEWFAQHHMPPLAEFTGKKDKELTPEQVNFLKHVADVVQNRACTISDCPYRNTPVPEWLRVTPTQEDGNPV